MQAAVAWAKWRLKTANLRLRKSVTDAHGTKELSLYLPIACLVYRCSRPPNRPLRDHAFLVLILPIVSPQPLG